MFFLMINTLSKKRPPDIHCRDRQGNTPLHCAAYRGQKQRVGKMLKSSQPQDQELALYQTVFDLACSEEIKQILVGSHDKVSLKAYYGRVPVFWDGIPIWWSFKTGIYPSILDKLMQWLVSGSKALRL
ncbi:hypothetical protein J4Q44_G00188140 [Coregonus suidteri]|uniref:Uncharacterized protein n=1 Tax=Coregonus suidteri TaxID=861788 RepID=A0AAN8QNH5_9TELE